MIGLMDPERLFVFAEVPGDFPPDAQEELFKYWLSNCRKFSEQVFERKVDEIRSRANGWCSIGDLERAGYVMYGGGPIGLKVPISAIQEIASKYEKFAIPLTEYADAY